MEGKLFLWTLPSNSARYQSRVEEHSHPLSGMSGYRLATDRPLLAAFSGIEEPTYSALVSWVRPLSDAVEASSICL